MSYARDLFPRLKGRGPIEAEDTEVVIQEVSLFPRLKGRGPIEAYYHPT